MTLTKERSNTVNLLRFVNPYNIPNIVMTHDSFTSMVSHRDIVDMDAVSDPLAPLPTLDSASVKLRLASENVPGA